MKKLILILFVVGIGTGTYYIIHNKQNGKEELVEVVTEKQDQENTLQSINPYKNTKNNYSLELPNSWGVAEDGSDVFAFPVIEKRNGLLDVDSTYKNNTTGITIMTLGSGASKEKNEILYRQISKNSQEIEFKNTSDDIFEIKSVNLEESEPEDSTYGYKGTSYVIRAKKRVYVINIFYRNIEDKAFQEQNIAKIIASLKEE